MSQQRIQRRRTAGSRLPAGAVYVGRPTRWGNPFRAGVTYRWVDNQPCPWPNEAGDVPEALGGRFVECETVEVAVAWYEAWVTEMVPVMARDARTELAGRDLACWCPPGQACHVDVLIRLANVVEVAR